MILFCMMIGIISLVFTIGSLLSLVEDKTWMFFLPLFLLCMIGFTYDLASPVVVSYKVIKTTDPSKYLNSVVNDGKIKTIIVITRESKWKLALSGARTSTFIYMEK